MSKRLDKIRASFVADFETLKPHQQQKIMKVVELLKALELEGGAE